MQTSEIQAFLTLARLGHLTNAASELCISQPAMTRRISQLEQELGVPLFERLPRGVRLTAAGQALLPFAHRAIAALQDGTAAVRSIDQADRGIVKLGMVGTLASTELPEVLKRFRAGHPEIRVVLHTGRSEQISHMVRSGEIDLGLRYFGETDTDLVATPAHDEPLCVVAASDTQWVSGVAKTASDLSGVPWVLFPTTGEEPYARLIMHQLQRHGLAEAETVIIDSMTAQKRLIEADFGLGLLPESGVQEELRLGTLVKLEIPELRVMAPVTMLQRRHGYLSQAARCLLEALVDHGA